MITDEQILNIRAFAEREQVRERVREAVGAALERVPELAHIRMIGPLVDYVSNAACEAAGLPAIRPTNEQRR